MTTKARNASLVGILVFMCFAITYFDNLLVVNPTPSNPEPKKEASQKKKIEPVPVTIHVKNIVEKSEIEDKRTENSGNDKGAVNGSNGLTILASFQMPVNENLQFMLQKGAQIVVYDSTNDRLIAPISLDGRVGRGIHHQKMSTRARRITNDFPARRHALQEVTRQFGKSNYEILLLIPRKVDDIFNKGINSFIKQEDLDKNRVSMARVTYYGNSESITVMVNELITRDRTIMVERAFKL